MQISTIAKINIGNRMRKFNLKMTLQVMGASVAILLCASNSFGQTVEKKDSIPNVPSEITLLLKPSCMPCHSNEGRDKPKSKVNFSVWEQYSPMEKKMLAGSIEDEVKKVSMPPKRFLESHPEAALTASQIDQIVQWCEALKTKP